MTGTSNRFLQDFYCLELFAGLVGDGSTKNGVKQFTRRDLERARKLTSRFQSGGFDLEVCVNAMVASVP